MMGKRENKEKREKSEQGIREVCHLDNRGRTRERGRRTDSREKGERKT